MEKTTCCDFAATELYHPAYMFGYATCLASCSSLCTDELVKLRRQLLPLCWLLLLLRLLAHLLLLWLLWQLWLLLLCLLWQLWLLLLWLLWQLWLLVLPLRAPVAAFATAIGPLFLLLYLKHRCDRCEMLLQDVGRDLAVLRRHFSIDHNPLKVFDLPVIQREWYITGHRHRGSHARRAREVCSASTAMAAQLVWC
jgi:hypothetical protein